MFVSELNCKTHKLNQHGFTYVSYGPLFLELHMIIVPQQMCYVIPMPMLNHHAIQYDCVFCQPNNLFNSSNNQLTWKIPVYLTPSIPCQ